MIRGKTMGERMLDDAIQQELWRRRRRAIYLLLAIIATAALVKIAWGF